MKKVFTSNQKDRYFAPSLISNFSMLTLVILFLFLSLKVEAAEFTSFKGFSLNYPDDWVVATREQKEQTIREFQSIFDKIGDVDFSKIEVMIFNPEDDEFVESINVIVAPGKVPIDEIEREYPKTIRDQYSRVGLLPSNIEVIRTKLGNNEAVSANFDMINPRENILVKLWQVIIPGNSQTYFFTCSAPASDYHQFEPIFTEAINSIQIDAGLGGFWYSLPGGLRYAIIGALIGLAFGVVKNILK